MRSSLSRLALFALRTASNTQKGRSKQTLLSSSHIRDLRRPFRDFHTSPALREEVRGGSKALDEEAAAKDETEKTMEEPAEAPSPLEAENAGLKERLDEMEDKYKRALAAMDNIQKRTQREVTAAKDFAIQSFAKDLLEWFEIPDILEKALGSVEEGQLKADPALASLHEGLRLTDKELMTVFRRHGLRKFSPEVGEKFDPDRHEALMRVAAEGSAVADTVSAVLKSGYLLKDRTIRASQVAVYQ